MVRHILALVAVTAIGGAASAQTTWTCSLKDTARSGHVPSEFSFALPESGRDAQAWVQGDARQSVEVTKRDALKVELDWRSTAAPRGSSRDRAERTGEGTHYHATFLRGSEKLMLKVRPDREARSFTGLGTCRKAG